MPRASGEQNGTMTTETPRGELRVLLGAAPGVGKTFAMLNEGRRRRDRGTDVVVGIVETHGRDLTARQIGDLEVVPRKQVQHKGATFTEMDLDAILARHPEVALVDELAHTNVPGSGNERRCQDVEALLAAGIDVITTVNVQHLESLNDVVAQITGIKQRETVPDAVVRAADQIELVDMAPEALRRRMAHGNVYPAARIDAALRNYFRPGNLAALRELALLWVADRVDAGLSDYRRLHAIDRPWAARERVLVALSGGPEGAALIRRGARIASRGVGGELVAVFVARTDGLVERNAAELAKQRKLVEDLSGTFQTLTGDDPAAAVLEHARSINATQIVVGQSRRRAWQRLFGAPTSQRIIDDSGDIDVHTVHHEWSASGEHRAGRRELGRTRRFVGIALSVLLPVLLTFLLEVTNSGGAPMFTLMLFLAAVVTVALVGGLVAAMIAAVASSLLANWFFTPPVFTFTIADPANIVALVIFVVVGIAVAVVVDQGIARARRAAEARAEADVMVWLANQSLRGELTVQTAVDNVRSTFQVAGVQYRRRTAPTAAPEVLGASGECRGEPSSTVALTATDDIAVYGRPLTVAEQRVLAAFGGQVTQHLEKQGLKAKAEQVGELTDRSAFQTALLAAVSHDLRTPLAGIRAASSSLLSTDVELSPADQRTLAEMIDLNAERLGRLIDNLLEMTRLQTSDVAPRREPVALPEVLTPALSGLPDGAVEVSEAESLPLLDTDPGLAERILANVIDNAVRHQPPGEPVRVEAAAVGGTVEVRVIDNGPGVPVARRQAIFQPFQRLGDSPSGNGLGLGLSVAQGFAHAVGATIEPDDTPGGGLTMTVAFPLARGGEAEGSPRPSAVDVGGSA